MAVWFSHIASIFKSGEVWTNDYLIATVVLAALPLVITIYLTGKLKRQTSRSKETSRNKKNRMQEAMEKITNSLEDRLSQSRAGRLVKKTEAGVPIPARGSVEETGPIEDTSVNAMHKPQQAKLVAQPSNVDFLYEANTVEVSVPIAPAGWHPHWSQQHNTYYFYNCSTGTSSWELPESELAKPNLERTTDNATRNGLAKAILEAEQLEGPAGPTFGSTLLQR